MKVIPNLKYTDKHEWVKIDGEFAYIGITAYAQNQLGEVLFVEMPEVDDELTKEDVVELANEYVESYDLEGFNYSFEVNEEHLLETIIVDYSIVNIQELMNIGFIESVDDAKYISLKETLTTLKDTGFICE